MTDEWKVPDWMVSYTIIIDREELWLNNRPHSHKRIVNKASAESIAGQLGCGVEYLTRVAQHWANRMNWPTHTYIDRASLLNGPDDVDVERERPNEFAEVRVGLDCEVRSVTMDQEPDRLWVGNSWDSWPETNVARTKD